MATLIKHPTVEMREGDMKKLIRNALLVAGHELGEQGDHWPVVKNTITDVMRDWEELEIERAVHAELGSQMERYLSEMDELLKTCDPKIAQKAAPHIAELRAVYEAAFTEPETEIIDLTNDADVFGAAGKPIHVRRAENLIDMLFDDRMMEESYA